jgi:hypothetical protein
MILDSLPDCRVLRLPMARDALELMQREPPPWFY